MSNQKNSNSRKGIVSKPKTIDKRVDRQSKIGDSKSNQESLRKGFEIPPKPPKSKTSK